MRGIAYEAERRPSHCKHVSEPKSPKILYGCKPSEAVAIAAKRAKQAVDAKGKKFRPDALVFLGGVASYPAPWKKIREDKAEAERLRKWLRYLIEHLKKQYGVLLHYILLHEDEPYPHVHWGCVPVLEADRRMRISTLHPGRAAYDRVFAATRDNRAGCQAYELAMKQWQDAFHAAVYAKVGIRARWSAAATADAKRVQGAQGRRGSAGEDRRLRKAAEREVAGRNPCRIRGRAFHDRTLEEALRGPHRPIDRSKRSNPHTQNFRLLIWKLGLNRPRGRGCSS